MAPPATDRDVQVQHGPELEAKIRDVAGLYLAPEDNAVVVCADDKSQIQALDRTAPPLPPSPGLPARRTHDYTQHGSTTLFAALETATGKIGSLRWPPGGVPDRDDLYSTTRMAPMGGQRSDC